MPKVSAIIPAAGLSSRMGGPNKLLALYRDQRTVVGSVVGVLLNCNLNVMVVTGRDADEVAKAVSPAKTVFNPHFEDGLGSSIAVGVRACEESDGYLIALGDMPGIHPALISELISKLEPTSIVVPIAGNGMFGHPVLFGSEYRNDLEKLGGDTGGKPILLAHQDKIIRIPVKKHLIDLDSKEDFARDSNVTTMS